NNAQLEADLLHIQEYKELVAMLQGRYSTLRTNCAFLEDILNNPELQMAKSIASAGFGMFLFCGGFFVGKTFFLAAATLFVSVINPLSIPIILGSLIVGVAAFSFYWFSERASFENLIGSWFGLDKEKIDQLSNNEDIADTEANLNKLYHGLVEREVAIKEIICLKKQVAFSAPAQQDFPLPDAFSSNKSPPHKATVAEDLPFFSDVKSMPSANNDFHQEPSENLNF
ncbi:MAG: hypothetical protein K2X39_10620, partial [Silvanigrellaceae bacterium]|nr:hypothetical protein [Silvanigrellaceae bacterium]